MIIETENQLREYAGKKWSTYDPAVLPAWVADMDFALADPIEQALTDEARTGGHLYPSPATRQAVVAAFTERMAQHFRWSEIDPRRVDLLTDLVQALVACVLAYSEEQDAVTVITPIYPPFLSVVENTGRRVARVELRAQDGHYAVDWEELETTIRESGSRLLLLCSPHNPTGKVFTTDELRRLAELAATYDMVVISDEIHSDIVYPGQEFIPFAHVAAEAGAEYVCLQGATKSFNIAGLRCAIIYFGSDALHARFTRTHPPRLLGQVSTLAMRGTLAAWSPEAAPWFEAVLDQLTTNRARVADWVAAHPGVLDWIPPESTYFGWIWLTGPAYRRLCQDSSATQLFLDGGVALSPGGDFAGGDDHVRLNFATSTPLLEEILDRMTRCLESSPG